MCSIYFLEPNVVFRLTVQNPKIISLSSCDKKQHPLLIFEQLESKNIWHFCLIN